MWLNLYLIRIVIRVCLVVLFPFSALDKIVFWKDAIAQADDTFLPKWSGPPLLVAAIIVEGVAPFLIVIGWHDRVAALVLIADRLIFSVSDLRVTFDTVDKDAVWPSGTRRPAADPHVGVLRDPDGHWLVLDV
ncbi:MAG: DoxX family protein [Gammaproteobacteria bacterium]